MVHDAASTGYDLQAGVYASVRPRYHPALIERFVREYADGVVVELGAGTGIFTSQLVEAGCSPIAVEPVSSMRDELVAAHPDVEVIDGTAEHTGLVDQSVDTVVVAQAFHWFDHDAALKEIARIVRPGGFLVCAWNVRDETVDWVRQYTEILDPYAKDTPRYRTMKWRQAIDGCSSLDLVEEWSVANPVPATPQLVVERAVSTSFIAALEPAPQRKVLDEIQQLADSVGDSFDYPYRSELQAWSRSS